jgi:alpha-glucosidase
VHVRHGAALLLHRSPAYTVETRQGPISLLVTQCLDGHAFGTTYLNDGVSDPPGPSRIVTVHSGKNSLNISTAGAFHISQKLAEVTILGVLQQSAAVLVDGKTKSFTYEIPQQKLVISKLRVDLNTETTIEWE